MASLLSQSESHTGFQSLKSIQFPALALLISGGHTEIVHIESFGKYKILGTTVDDAVGEAFDKVARMLNFPYPGGPEISKLAEQARKEKIPNTITLPRPMIHSHDLNFSFSGLKTAVLYTLKKIDEPTPEQIQDIAREFENSVTEVLISKIQKALEEHGAQSLIIGGGVIANTYIRQAFENLAQKNSLPLYLPVSGLSGDNALMIALCGSFVDSTQSKSDNSKGLRAEGNLSL